MQKLSLIGFAVLSLGVFVWMDSFIIGYPSFAPWLIQTLLVFVLVRQASRSKLHLLLSEIIAFSIGWAVSVAVHNAFAFIYYDGFILSVKEHYQAGLIFQHLWFMCWSSLVTLGFIQGLVLMLLLRWGNSK